MVTKYTDEERQRVYDEARAAIEGAEAVLAKPRPEISWPPLEDKLERWRREAAEQEQRFAAERAASQPLTEFEASRLEARMVAQISAGLAGQKELLADSLAAVREVIEAFEAKIAALSEELGQLRADLTIAKAFAIKPSGGEVVDLPALPLRKRA